MLKLILRLRTTVFLLITIAALIQSAYATEPGKVVLELAPTKDNPRNSEGAFATLKSGRIIFYYTQFYGGARDESAARIVGIFSDDNGDTWSKEPQVIVPTGTNQNVMSVSLLRLQSGKLALFYLAKNSLHDCRPMVCFSSDEAKTWTAPKTVVSAPGYFVLNNDRVIQTKSGRLILPVALHRAKNDQPHNSRTLDYRAISIWYLSDDEGQTWREADIWWAIPVPSKSGLQEPGVVELDNGNIFSWLRTDQICQYSCLSTNTGITWSAPVPTALKTPTAPASVKRLPGSSDLVAIYNDHSGEFKFDPKKRSPLVLAISRDNANTWGEKKVIESDPESSFCYTAIHFSGDSVLLAYCAGNPKLAGLDRLRMRKIKTDSLINR